MAYEIIEVELLVEELKEKSDKTINNYKTELLNIRAGRANAHILDKIVVDYYGTPTPINQMANITIPEGKLLVISVWDSSALKAVEKAIVAANIGIMPTNDGKVIRLVFPDITEDRRKSIVKEIRASAEKVKVALRNERRDAIETLKKLKKDNIISEDIQTSIEKDVEKIVVNQIATVDKMTAEKEVEILSV